MLVVSPPENISALKQRARTLDGKKLIDLANNLGIQVPNNLKHAKGWIGQLLESALGATAGSKALHDFPELKVELKTIPISKSLSPIESTYVCTAPPIMECLTWEESWASRKLQNVLWVPIITDSTIPITERKIISPFFWQPSLEQQDILRQDWEELTELLYMGGTEKLSAKYGNYLHIRPKAANSKVLIDVYNEDAEKIKTVPKGFYLRTSFTKKLIISNLKVTTRT